MPSINIGETKGFNEPERKEFKVRFRVEKEKELQVN